MVPSLRKLASRLKQEAMTHPSEVTTTPTSTATRNRVTILEKHRKEIQEKVVFSHISHHLLTSEYLSKEDAFEICLLPLQQQMALCHRKVIDALGRPTKEGRPDLWTILLRALNVQHSGLTVKLDSDLHKLSKREKPSRLRKEDIGAPSEFKHLKHIGHTPITQPPSSYSTKSNPFRRFWSLRSTSTSNTTPTSAINGNPPSVITSSPFNLGIHPEVWSPGDAALVKEFLQKAGVTEGHLRKPGSRKLILDFIDKNGGMEAIRKEIMRQEEDTQQTLPPEEEVKEEESGESRSSPPISILEDEDTSKL